MQREYFSENLKGRHLVEDPGIHGRIILKSILRKQDIRVWTSFIWLRTASTAWFCKYGNKIFGSIKDRVFLYQLRNHMLFKDSAPWC